jgi:AraC family transcriptional regulator, positive regulator of tynA and feaB
MPTSSTRSTSVSSTSPPSGSLPSGSPPSTPSPAPQTWSTLSVPPAGQFTYWRELICQAFLDLTPESDLRDQFTGIVTQWGLGELSIGRIDSQRQRVRRTDQDLARGPQSGYYANLQLRGTSEMRQGGRMTILRPGDIALVDTSQRFAFEFGTDFRQLTLFIPKWLLEAQVSGPMHTSTRIDTNTGVGAAVRHAMLALTRSRLAPDSAARLATLTGGMLAMALDSFTSDWVGGSAARSARSYRAALADIEEHLADEDLSPAATARRLGISVRWLHRLFAGSERTYAGTVRRLRLEMALRNLQDPGQAHLRVIDIAADAGFSDVTSFHRAFQREFGRTPAQVRTVSS